MLPPQSCHRAALNVATQLLPATTRRRRDDAEAATAGESLQPPGALTVAAGPRCPHSRCSPRPQSLHPRPSQSQALTVAAARGCPAAQAVAAAPRCSSQSLQPPRRPCSASSRCSPQVPLTVAAAPQRCSLCSPSSRCSPQMGSAPTVGALQQAVAASPRCPSQSPHRPRPSQSLQPHGRG